jgi:SAM-dependent methyltransferase
MSEMPHRAPAEASQEVSEMRGFLRGGIVLIAIVAAGSVALRASGAWRRLEAQGKWPSGVAGRVITWVYPRMFGWLYAVFAEILDLQADDEVLDVGCGTGAFLRTRASHVRRIAGLDHSEVAIAVALRENCERVAEGTAQFVVGDVTALPWPSETFSAVTSNCVDCYEDVARPALEEMYRVLRPGGRAVVADDRRQMMEEIGFSRVSVGRLRRGFIAGEITTGSKG